ncbi:cryptochrome/photolyase family protein [Luteibaculum oceani]|uniref:Cryptochrome/photolyase family protein n=1 Tax=Luteibaculum oceani TaxID=1294296 RepID=A0A5C6UZ68_9FLAO|nr:cryptochrome/photolyase family protein [Luteibaculum oceani]
MKSKHTKLRLILGDQLNADHSWFKELNADNLYVLMEIRSETDYVKHHIQKVVGIFTAMRQFAEQLQNAGHKVVYLKISDSINKQDFGENLRFLINRFKIKEIEIQEPDEYRLQVYFLNLKSTLNKNIHFFDSEHFITKKTELKEFFAGKKQTLMESFYRHLRNKHQVLMDGENPAGGKWNYDAYNRKKLPKKHTPPPPLLFEHNVEQVYKEVLEQNVKTLGEIDPRRFSWPINKQESIQLFDYFLEYLLPHFGDYQDALSEEFWSIYHSRISFSLNLKMLSPKWILKRIESHWRNNQDTIDISQAEGFIRQILGWREFMRGIYWREMPQYESLNHLSAQRKLPRYFWTGKTKMQCLKRAINQSLKHGYAHHIQRLMVTGNFCALAGINPDEVDDWYLGIYMDAFQWVEITNTRGMSQYADGGIVGTKPYVSSASYMHKMGDHCVNCQYDRKIKIGDKACPFNSLYWHFINRNQDKLQNNPRMGMMYKVWNKMENQEDILNQAELHLKNIESL